MIPKLKAAYTRLSRWSHHATVNEVSKVCFLNSNGLECSLRAMNPQETHKLKKKKKKENNNKRIPVVVRCV